MASFFNISSRFGRQPKQPTPPGQPSPTDQRSPTSVQSPASSMASPGVLSPSVPEPSNENRTPNMTDPAPQQRRTPYFFREENSGLIVKGNFMTLAAKPEHVEKGEWLAHQVVEQYRLLDSMLRIIQETDSKTKLPICNQQSCPTMSAVDTIYTWLDNNRQPKKIPAYQYVALVQKWIMGKINDQRIFPIDVPDLGARATDTASGARDWLGKSSGFPEHFETDIKNLYRQMFRCYAHIYHAHWLLFYHMSAYKELNTCFIHFVNVGKLWDLLNERDTKPMQPLIDIWTAKALIPAAKAPAVEAIAPAQPQSQQQPQPQSSSTQT